jgi:hypothetical protein
MNFGEPQMLRDQEREEYMSKAVAVKKSTTAWESPLVTPLDEAVWQAWKAKGTETLNYVRARTESRYCKVC